MITWLLLVDEWEFPIDFLAQNNVRTMLLVLPSEIKKADKPENIRAPPERPEYTPDPEDMEFIKPWVFRDYDQPIPRDFPSRDFDPPERPYPDWPPQESRPDYREDQLRDMNPPWGDEIPWQDMNYGL